MDAEAEKSMAAAVNALLYATADPYARHYRASGMTEVQIRADMDAVMSRFEAARAPDIPRTPEMFSLTQEGLASLELMFSMIVIDRR